MPVEIHSSSIVEQGAELGEDVFIGPFCYVGPNVTIGDRTRLHSHASVTGRTTLGNSVEMYAHSALGGPPQSLGFKDHPDSRLEVGDRTVFRESTSVHSGTPSYGGLTKIGSDCFLMHASHFGHDCHVGNNVVVANAAQIGGHCEVADHVWFGGSVAIHQFTRIGRNAFVGGGSILVEDLIPFGSVVGNHAKLAGLNMNGLKRRGFSRADIMEMRSAYKAIFTGDGTFSDRVTQAATDFANRQLAMEIVDFVQTKGKRPICKPG